MYGKTLKQISFVLAVAVMASPAWAMNSRFATGYLYDDNLYKQEKKVADSIMVFKAMFSQKFSPKRHRTRFSYFYDTNKHVSRTSEDFDTHKLDLTYSSALDRPFVLGSNLQYLISKNPRGDTATLSQDLSAPDTWNSKIGSLSLSYRYQEAMKVIFKFSQIYKNHDLASSKYKDLSTSTYKFNNYYYYSGKTIFNFGVRRKLSVFSNKSFGETIDDQYFAGMRWKHSGKTTGTLRLGWTSIQSIANNSINHDFLAIYGRFNWKRTSYSQIQLEMARKSLENFTTAHNYYLNNYFTASWQQNIGYKLFTSLKGSVSLNQYGNGNNEAIWSISPSVVYRVTRHFDITSKLIYRTKKSTYEYLNYDNFMGNISLTMKY